MEITVVTEPEEWGEKGTACVRNIIFCDATFSNEEDIKLANEGLADYARLLAVEDDKEATEQDLLEDAS